MAQGADMASADGVGRCWGQGVAGDGAYSEGDDKMRRLVVDLCSKWRSLVCHKRVSGMPRTNNVTERVIGRSKVRYKTVRGYKSIYGMLNGLGLTQWVWSGMDGLCIGELVAA